MLSCFFIFVVQKHNVVRQLFREDIGQDEVRIQLYSIYIVYICYSIYMLHNCAACYTYMCCTVCYMILTRDGHHGGGVVGGGGYVEVCFWFCGGIIICGGITWKWIGCMMLIAWMLTIVSLRARARVASRSTSRRVDRTFIRTWWVHIILYAYTYIHIRIQLHTIYTLHHVNFVECGKSTLHSTRRIYYSVGNILSLHHVYISTIYYIYVDI